MSTHNIPFSIKNQINPNLQEWDFAWGFENEFETAVVNEPSVFQPLKFEWPRMYFLLAKFKFN